MAARPCWGCAHCFRPLIIITPVCMHYVRKAIGMTMDISDDAAFVHLIEEILVRSMAGYGSLDLNGSIPFGLLLDYSKMTGRDHSGVGV